MRKCIFILLLLVVGCRISAQTTFKCGWTTYKASMIIHEYTYSYTLGDSIRLFLADSTKTFVAPDSAATLNIDYPFKDNITYKVANTYNAKKKLIKSDELKNDGVQVSREYKYDDKNRKVYETEDNKISNNIYKKTFSYSTEKNGDQLVSESAYFNGRIEFYTRSYYDKRNVKYKEVRLNDDNKEVVHVENFIYNDAGRLKERSVYFTQFKVTKTFPEGGDSPADCFKSQVVNITDKASPATKIAFLKKLIAKNKPSLLDPSCHEFECRFYNSDCEVLISTTKTNNIKKVVFRYKERLHF
jgi:hypothetical protein